MIFLVCQKIAMTLTFRSKLKPGPKRSSDRSLLPIHSGNLERMDWRR